jgi:3-hydroxyisobutyrate dehydrogenase
MARIAVLGTGIMGGPMAQNLRRTGHEVRVWNRTRAKAESLVGDGAYVAATPSEAVAGAEIVLTMLADANAVTETMLALGGLDAMSREAVWIQSSTIGVPATEQLVALADEREVALVDAPVLGSKKQAEDGELVVLASGPEEVRDECEPVFSAIGGEHFWLGAAGTGTRVKLVADNWILCTAENIAETFVLADALGIDPRSFLDVIAGGAMDMPYAHSKGEAILNENFALSFPLSLAHKDLGLILEAAGERELPLVRTTLRQFDRAIELGHGDEDMSAVYYASAAPIETPSA